MAFNACLTYCFLGHTLSCTWITSSSKRYFLFSVYFTLYDVAMTTQQCFFFCWIIELATGVFKPAPPFSSLSAVPSNAIIFGSLLAVQRFGCKTAEFTRGVQDPWNDFFGCAVAYPYYQHFLIRHVRVHNRAIGGAVVLAVAYSNLA
jgi:hypothetical protein